jgi:alpha-acetolactate decarboxylase
MRAVLRWTKFDADGKPTIEETPSDENLKNRWSESSLSEEELVAWVQGNWQEMRRRLRERQDARYRRDIESGKIKPKAKKIEAATFGDDVSKALHLPSAGDAQSPET